MASFETDLIKALEAEYFGPEFFKEQELIDKILTCTSLEKFRALNLDLTSPAIQGIFAQANITNADGKAFTAEDLQKIFKDLRPAINNSAFI